MKHKKIKKEETFQRSHNQQAVEIALELKQTNIRALLLTITPYRPPRTVLILTFWNKTVPNKSLEMHISSEG